jgi:hypothetical protein
VHSSWPPAVCLRLQCIEVDCALQGLLLKHVFAIENRKTSKSKGEAHKRGHTIPLLQALGSEEDASQLGAYANLFMNGGEVFKFAVRAVPTVSRSVACAIHQLHGLWHSCVQPAAHIEVLGCVPSVQVLATYMLVVKRVLGRQVWCHDLGYATAGVTAAECGQAAARAAAAT